jgi:protein TonB
LFRNSGIPGAPGSGGTQVSDLGLQVETRGSFLLVSWNRDNPILKTSKSALLTVFDGDFPKQEIPLDSTQLATGDFVYATVSERVLFRLEAGGDQKASESVLAILKGRRPLETTSELVSNAPVPTGAQPAAEPPVQDAPPPVEPAPSVTANGDAGSPVARPVRTFVPPPSNRPAEQPTRTVYIDPPAVQAVPSSLPVSSPLAALPASGTQAPPPPAPAPEPVKTEQRPSSATYLQPSPVRQVPPTVAPQILRTLVNKDTLVEVRVYVSASGKVTRAEVASGSTHSFLTNAAIDAARKWTFAPARVDGKAVDGEAKIVFLFRPPQSAPGR